MTANEPPNPYAPSAAVARDAAEAPARQPWRRAGAIVLSIIAHPLSGAGLYLLGRPRRFAGWLAAALASWGLMLAAVRAPQPKLFLAMVVATSAVMLAALVDTIVARRGTVPALGRGWLMAIALVVIAKGGAAASKHALAEGFSMPSASMAPTLLAGDAIMVKKGRAGVQRGDVVVFRALEDPRVDYVKRVIAVGGDHVEITRGVVSVNGAPLPQGPVDGVCPAIDEPGPCRLLRESNGARAYTIMAMDDRNAPDLGPTIVPADQVFLLGDNRDNSLDSRHFGPVPVDNIKGTPSFVYFSADRRAGVRWSRVGHGVE